MIDWPLICFVLAAGIYAADLRRRISKLEKDRDAHERLIGKLIVFADKIK